MKFSKKLLGAAMLFAVALFTLNTNAQRAWDLFAVPRQVVLQAPYNTLGTTTKSNGVMDCLPFTGVGKITILCSTNTGASGGTMAFTLYGSNDSTNWTALTGLAYITNTTSISYTNTAYGGNPNALTNSDSFLLPGTIITPTASTAGFATPYLNPIPFTNTGTITVANVNSAIEIGIVWDSAPRYISLQATCAGTANFTYSATADGYIH